MAVHKLFNSEQREDTESGVSYRVTFYSTDFSELNSFIQANYAHNSVTAEYGRIKSVKFRPEGGIHYCELVGEHDKGVDGILYVAHTENGPDRHEITSVCIPMPLEKLQGYRAHWNHYLWKAVPEDSTAVRATPPDVALTYTDNKSFTSDSVLYAWTEGIYPPSTDPGVDVVNGEEKPRKWIPCTTFPTKPGVKQVDWYTYQITEEGDHANLEGAYWVMKQALNTPTDRPRLGSMGVTGGSWKCDHASITPSEKKRWRSKLVWTWAPGGWDEDLYPVRLKTT